MRNILGPLAQGISAGLEAREAVRQRRVQEARDKALFVANMRRLQLVNSGMEADQAQAQAEAEANALFMREVEGMGAGGAPAPGGAVPGGAVRGGGFPGGGGAPAPGAGFGAGPMAGPVGAAPTLPRLDLTSARTVEGVAPLLQRLFARAGGGGGAPLGPGGQGPTTPTGLTRLPATVPATVPMAGPGLFGGGAGGDARPSTGPPPGTHPKLLKAWARLKASRGELTPEDMVTAGLLSPEQMPRGWQAQQGYRMLPAQESAADAKARSDAAATIQEAVGDVATWLGEGIMGPEEARTYLADLGIEEEARVYGLPYTPPPFGESPKAVRAWADAAKSALEAGYVEQFGEKMPTGETPLQEQATAALTAQRRASAALTGARRSWGPSPSPGREPITLTSVNVEINRLRSRLSGGRDPISGDTWPGMEEGPEREEVEAELRYWQQYRALLGGPPVGGAEPDSKGALIERAGFGTKAPEKLSQAKTTAEIHAFIRDKGPAVFAQEGRQELGYTPEETAEVLERHLPVISPAMIAKLTGRPQQGAPAPTGLVLGGRAPGGGWSLPGQSGYPAP